jgi:O-antigen/teichoic acid export membrane protein
MTKVRHYLKSLLPKGNWAKSIALLAGGTALGQVLSIAASPFLTRLYSPEDFGILSLYVSFLGIISVVAGLRYELAIPLPKTDEDARKLLVLSLLFVGMTSSLVLVLTVWLGPFLVRLTYMNALAPYLWLLPFGLLLVGSYQSFNYWAVREKAFGRIARTKMSQSLGAVLTQLSLGLLEFRPLGLLAGQLVGQAAGITTLSQSFFSRTTKIDYGLSSLKAVALRYKNFPLYSAGSGLLNSAGLFLPALLLTPLYGPLIAGWLALGDRIIKLPLNLVGQSVAQVYLSEASSLARDNAPRLLSLFRKASKQLLLLGCLLIIPAGILAPGLFALVFGESWRGAGVYVRLMIPFYILQLVVNPLSQTLNVLEKQAIQTLLDGLRVLLVILSLTLPYYLGYGATLAIGLYSAVMVILYGLFWWVTHYQLKLYSRKILP